MWFKGAVLMFNHVPRLIIMSHQFIFVLKSWLFNIDLIALILTSCWFDVNSGVEETVLSSRIGILRWLDDFFVGISELWVLVERSNTMQYPKENAQCTPPPATFNSCSESREGLVYPELSAWLLTSSTETTLTRHCFTWVYSIIYW